MNEWREHPSLKGSFHPDHPDDLQVIVHDGEQRRSGKTPEACWVRVTALDGTLASPRLVDAAQISPAASVIEQRMIYRGTLLSQPRGLTTVKAGDSLRFIVSPGVPHPVQISDAYVRERPQWGFVPCGSCGADQSLDPPTTMARTRFPDSPSGSYPIVFTAFCSCGGTMMLGELESMEEGEETQDAPRKPWWKFW